MNILSAFSSLTARYMNDMPPICLKHNLLCVEWNLNFLSLPSETPSLRKLIRYFDDQRINRFHLPYTVISLYSDSSEKTEYLMSLMYYCFLLIKEFGAKYVVVYFGDHMKNIDKRNDFFYDYGKKVEEYGIKIGIENTIYGLTSNPKTLRDICSGAEVDCIFDIDHANSINKLDEYLLKVGNIVSHIHFFQS